MTNSNSDRRSLHQEAVLLAQPSIGEVQQVLPPPAESMSDGLSVIFTTSRSDVRRAKQLQVSRDLYMQCAALRQQVCYAFADTRLGKATELPEQGVPEAIAREAVHMPEANFFEAALDGPAQQHDPSSKELDASAIDAAVSHLLDVQIRLGLLDPAHARC